MTIYWTSDDCDGQAILTLHFSVRRVILFPYFDHCCVRNIVATWATMLLMQSRYIYGNYSTSVSIRNVGHGSVLKASIEIMTIGVSFVCV